LIVILLLATACQSTNDVQVDGGCPSEYSAQVTSGDNVDVALTTEYQLDAPTELILPNNGTDDLWVTERQGRLVAVKAGQAETILDLSTEVSAKGEGGLLGVELSPSGEWTYLAYSTESALIVAAWENSGGRPAGEARTILEVPADTPIHHSGTMRHLADGTMLIAIGDGGFDDQHASNAGSLSTIRGSIIRIRPTPDKTTPYEIPADNPFISEPGAAPEIWITGLRNPWKFAVEDDRLWIADVGAGCSEELNVLELDSAAGADLGWPDWEGHIPRALNPRPSIAPVYTYPHIGPTSAVIGGAVYRGDDFPALAGAFVFADWGQGTLQYLRETDSGWEVGTLSRSVAFPTAIALDADGEIMVATQLQGVMSMTPTE
jgi:glucose/arabinose dehydrogenase